MDQTIFTCTYLHLENQIYRVYWLRVALGNFAGNKTLQKISKLCSKFEVRIQNASITPEKEELYSTYKTGVAFQPSESLEKLLFNGSELNIYNTFEITIYDEKKLIAVGYFDMGKDSAAGITSFYDPAYKKYSLGKFLIYKKMLYCKSQQISYFYPGYFAPGCKAFDYKLEFGKDMMEYYDLGSGEWISMEKWYSMKGSIEENKQKLLDLQHQLSAVNIENRLYRYSHFQVNMFRELHGYELFDYLFFVYCFKFDPEVINPIIVYDLRDGQYHLFKCISVGKLKVENDNPEEYSTDLLKIAGTYYSSNSAQEMAEKMIEAFGYNVVSDT